MATVASSHKLFYTDKKNLNLKGTREQVIYHAACLSTPDNIMLEASVLLRKHTIGFVIPRNNRRLSRTIKASNDSEKHLQSLDSYLGKIHKDSKQTTMTQMKESIVRNKQLQAGDGLRLVEGYLGKVKESVGTAIKKDQESGTVRFSNSYMEFKTDKVETERKSADNTSDFYIIGALASLNIAVFLFEIATPVKNSNFELFSLPLLYGAKINNLIITGEWWRLVTPMFLHSGIFHIAFGIWILFTFGIKVSKEYGSLTFLFIYILGGITANLISFWHTPEPTVGGTGPMFALIGAWLIYQFQHKDVIARDESERMVQNAFLAAALICVLSNFGPIDDWSHFAATFTGVTYGFLTCATLQVKDASAEAAQRERTTLVKRYANPFISLVYFSLFLLLLSSLLFVIEPPLNLIE